MYTYTSAVQCSFCNRFVYTVYYFVPQTNHVAVITLSGITITDVVVY